MIKNISLAFSVILFSTSSFATEQVIWQTTEKVVINYQALLQQLPKTSKIKIFIPTAILSNKNQKIYAHFSRNTDNDYKISFDTIPDCHGAKYCQLGSVQGQYKANPEIYYNSQNQRITQAVILNANLRGYFTPAHAMGDFWPSQLVWRQGDGLYTVAWKINEANTQTQKTLMKLFVSFK
tara:strand:- start:277 stop:816 length:540 start_codon:yes stop_codon:yes gene_type:complete